MQCNSTQGLQVSVYAANTNCPFNAGSPTVDCANPNDVVNFYTDWVAAANQCYMIQIDGYAGSACYSKLIVNSIPLPCSPPSVTISGGGTYCTGSNISLGATGGGTYLWAGPSGYSSSIANPVRTNATSGMSGVYTVSVTTAGCTSTASVTVTVGNISITSSIVQPTCGLNNGAINVSPVGASYIWTGGLSGSNPTNVSPGTYTVTITQGSCSSSSSFVVSASSNTVVAGILGNLTICPGGSTNLTATGGANYTWSNGRTTAGNNITAIGTYTVTVTNAIGCKSTSSVSVAQAITTASISGATTMCAGVGGSTTLTASGGGTYVWNSGSISAANNITAAGTYTVTVTNSGCTSTAQSTVTLTTITATISGATTMCAGVGGRKAAEGWCETPSE